MLFSESRLKNLPIYSDCWGEANNHIPNQPIPSSFLKLVKRDISPEMHRSVERGFKALDQLYVISHDRVFESMADLAVSLEKVDGSTEVVGG